MGRQGRRHLELIDQLRVPKQGGEGKVSGGDPGLYNRAEGTLGGKPGSSTAPGLGVVLFWASD